MARKPKVQAVVPLTDFATAPLPMPGNGQDIISAAAPEPPATVTFHESRMIAVADLRVNSWNPNSMSDEEFDRLCQEILDIGFHESLVVVPIFEADGTSYFRILGGEHRYRAAQVLGLTSLPCVVLNEPRFQDEELQKALTMRLIFIRGKPDPVKTLVLIREFMQTRSAEQTRSMVGFAHREEWERMVFQMKGKLKKAGLPKEALAEFDKKAAEAKTAKDLGNVIRHIMESYKGNMPYGFVVFTHHGRKHTYIAATERMQHALDRLLSFTHAAGMELNAVLSPLFEQALEQLLLHPDRRVQYEVAEPLEDPPPDPQKP